MFVKPLNLQQLERLSPEEQQKQKEESQFSKADVDYILKRERRARYRNYFAFVCAVVPMVVAPFFYYAVNQRLYKNYKEPYQLKKVGPALPDEGAAQNSGATSSMWLMKPKGAEKGSPKNPYSKPKGRTQDAAPE